MKNRKLVWNARTLSSSPSLSHCGRKKENVSMYLSFVSPFIIFFIAFFNITPAYTYYLISCLFFSRKENENTYDITFTRTAMTASLWSKIFMLFTYSTQWRLKFISIEYFIFISSDVSLCIWRNYTLAYHVNIRHNKRHDLVRLFYRNVFFIRNIDFVMQ